VTLRGKPRERGCTNQFSAAPINCRNLHQSIGATSPGGKTAGLVTLRESPLKRAALIIIATLIIGATSPGGKTAGLATLRESRVNAAALIINATSPAVKPPV
jgi:hypothetical protein